MYQDLRKTFSLCSKCYGIVPAETEIVKGYGMVITKCCPVHGIHEAVTERDDEFFNWLADLPQVKIEGRQGMTALDITSRCNVRCPGCYALPDNVDDKPLESILNIAKNAQKSVLGLMGAEPTMRQDLPELITKLKLTFGKESLLYTNGILLENAEYLSELVESGLDKIALSLHLPSYIGEKAYNSKIVALKNIAQSNVKLDHIAISLKEVSEVEEALESILSLDYANIANGYVRLRAPSSIGGKRNKPCYQSEMVKELLSVCVKRGWRVEIMPFRHYQYAVFLKVAGRPIMLIRWPTVEDIDLQTLQLGPATALFVPQIGETQIVHQVIITEHIRSGGSLPPPPPADCPKEIAGIIA